MFYILHRYLRKFCPCALDAIRLRLACELLTRAFINVELRQYLLDSETAFMVSWSSFDGGAAWPFQSSTCSGWTVSCNVADLWTIILEP